MKTRYKHIEFVEAGEPRNGKRRYRCINLKFGETLGRVAYYPNWKRYVIDFEPDCVFDHICLADIQHFLGQLNEGK